MQTKNILQKMNTYDKIRVVIGPEGGLSPKEEELLNKKGFVSEKRNKKWACRVLCYGWWRPMYSSKPCRIAQVCKRTRLEHYQYLC